MPDLSRGLFAPEGFALVRADMVFDANALVDAGYGPAIVDQIAPIFLVGFESRFSRCVDGGPCDELALSTMSHADETAAAQKTEAVYFGLPAGFADLTSAYQLDGVGQSQFVVVYPTQTDAGVRDAIHFGFHVAEYSGEVRMFTSGQAPDALRPLAEQIVTHYQQFDVETTTPSPGGLALRADAVASALWLPLVTNGAPIPLAGRVPDVQAVYDAEFVGALNGLRVRYDLPGVAGVAPQVVINTLLQMPDPATGRSYLAGWPASYQPVLDQQGIVGEVVDPPVLIGDEDQHSGYVFTLRSDDGTVGDGLNLAGLFEGPGSSWFVSVSLRTAETRDPAAAAAGEANQATLRTVAEGLIPTYGSAIRAALNAGPPYQAVLAPPVPLSAAIWPPV